MELKKLFSLGFGGVLFVYFRGDLNPQNGSKRAFKYMLFYFTGFSSTPNSWRKNRKEQVVRPSHIRKNKLAAQDGFPWR